MYDFDFRVPFVVVSLGMRNATLPKRLIWSRLNIQTDTKIPQHLCAEFPWLMKSWIQSRKQRVDCR